MADPAGGGVGGPKGAEARRAAPAAKAAKAAKAQPAGKGANKAAVKKGKKKQKKEEEEEKKDKSETPNEPEAAEAAAAAEAAEAEAQPEPKPKPEAAEAEEEAAEKPEKAADETPNENASGQAAADDQAKAQEKKPPLASLDAGAAVRRPPVPIASPKDASGVDNIDGAGAQELDPQKILMAKRFGKMPSGGAAADDGEEDEKAAASRARAPVNKANKSHGSKRSVLLVEDVRVSQRVAKVALSRAKFKVTSVSTGADAVRKARGARFDMVLMDINLGPKSIDGVEATKEIRKHEAERGDDARTLIFGLTGSVSPADIEKYKAADMDGVIAKGNLLADAVQDALERTAEAPGEFIVSKFIK